MENKQQILTKISTITRRIEEDYPELTKYLEETRSTLPNNSGEATLNDSDLKNYLEQLESLIENHNKES
ncbi:MAG: hypothetical protein ACX93I_13850 [Winogradskyella sp.]|jgi:hypothetical protein